MVLFKKNRELYMFSRSMLENVKNEGDCYINGDECDLTNV